MCQPGFSGNELLTARLTQESNARGRFLAPNCRGFEGRALQYDGELLGAGRSSWAEKEDCMIACLYPLIGTQFGEGEKAN